MQFIYSCKPYSRHPCNSGWRDCRTRAIDLGDATRLNEILSESGYLFLRDALGRKRTQKASDDIISVLKSFGFVPPDASEAVWSGKVPSGNELTLGHGSAVTRINNLPSIKNLILRGGQVSLLKRLLGGEVFSWVENKDRGIRMMLPGKMSYSTVGGVKGTTVTPAHQDNYFFRTPNYYTTWIPLVDIDESVGDWRSPKAPTGMGTISTGTGDRSIWECRRIGRRLRAGRLQEGARPPAM